MFPLHFFQKPMIIISILIGIVWHTTVFLLFDPIVSVQAAQNPSSCYDQLKTEMEQVPYLQEAYNTIKDSSYNAIVFRDYTQYSNLYFPEFGFNDNNNAGYPNFRIRIYGFGRDTGYNHPPTPRIPATTEPWHAREYVLMEEYIRPSANEEHFLSCGIIKMEALDRKTLMDITENNVQFEETTSSLLKTDPTDQHRTWYSEGEGYDESCPIVKWRRFFVVPKWTQNSYFSRYDFLDVFPHTAVDNFSTLTFYDSIKKEIAQSTCDNLGYQTRAFLFPTVRAQQGEASTPTITYEGNNKYFPLYTTYEAMEQKFPEVSKYVKIRGIYDFSTIQKMVGEQDPVKRDAIVQSVPTLGELSEYYREKSTGNRTEDSRLEQYLQHPERLNTELAQKFDDAHYVPPQNTNAGGTINQNTNMVSNTNNSNSVPFTSKATSSSSSSPKQQPSNNSTASTSSLPWWMMILWTIILIIFIVLITLAVKKNNMNLLILALLIGLLGIGGIVWGSTVQTNILTPRQAKKFSDHCAQNIEFNGFATIESSTLPENSPLQANRVGDIVTLQLEGVITNNAPYAVICEQGKIITIVPTYKPYDTDSGRTYKLKISLRAMANNGYSITNAQYVRKVSSGQEEWQTLLNTCHQQCDFNNPSHPFEEVEKNPTAYVGCFTNEVHNFDILTGYNQSHELYATYHPNTTPVQTRGFQLMNFSPQQSFTFETKLPRNPIPPATTN
jgi:hypothetical protein